MGAIWEGGGEPELSHILIAVCFSIGFIAARFLLDSFVYKWLAFRLLNKGAVSVVNDEVSQSKIVKSTESMWKFTYYFTVQIWVLLIMTQEPWSMDTLQYFNGWPNQDLKFFRIGTIVLAVHDTSDVFLEAAKICKYSGKEMRASLFFGLFAVSWLLQRLIIFPFFIIKASSYHSIDSMKASGRYPSLLYYTVNTMLLTLLVFHVYWWKLICAMIMRQLSNQGKVGEDIRED